MAAPGQPGGAEIGAWAAIAAFDYKAQLCPAWRARCIEELCREVPNFASLPQDLQGKHLVQRMLYADVRHSCTGAVPQVPVSASRRAV
jgi:hypothetical protein